jgi:hypothetical protein
VKWTGERRIEGKQAGWMNLGERVGRKDILIAANNRFLYREVFL